MSDLVTKNVHLINLLSFESLLKICNKLGDNYQPERLLIRTFNLNALYKDAKAAYENFVVEMDAFNDALSARQKEFSNVKSTAERMISLFAESGIQYEILEQLKIDNATVFAQSIFPRKSLFVDYGMSVHDEALLRNISETQQIYEEQVYHLNKLLKRAAVLVGYTPEDEELKISVIKEKIIRMKALNKLVAKNFHSFSRAKFVLDTTFYIKQESVVNIGLDVKTYLTHTLKPNSKELKAIQNLDLILVKKKVN